MYYKIYFFFFFKKNKYNIDFFETEKKIYNFHVANLFQLS